MGIGALEDLLLAELKTATVNRVREVKALPGRLSDDLPRRMAADAPALYVTLAGGRRNSSGTSPAVSGRWGVYAVTNHANSQEARRRGDSRVIGAYERLELAVTGVHDRTFQGYGTAQLLEVENLFSGAFEGRQLTVYGAVFNLPTDLYRETDAALDDFETFDTDYDWAPPGGQVDAEDTVTLEPDP